MPRPQSPQASSATVSVSPTRGTGHQHPTPPQLTDSKEVVTTMLTVYGQPNCQPCRMAEHYLTRENVPYSYVDLSKDTEALARLRAAGHLQTPIIETPTQTTSGFNPDALRKAALEVQASTAVYTDGPDHDTGYSLD